MRDFLPSDVRKREYVIGIIKEVYESYGFEPLETPAVENIETLTGKYGEEGNQLIYKILKRGEKLNVNADEKDLSDLALRYDLTVPLARVVANHKNDLPRFFKRYQIQPVWRADRPARGRYREFYQCDVDAIGSSSMIVEAELCAAVSEILTGLGFNDFAIRVNHRGILDGILEAAAIDKERRGNVLGVIDKIDKIGNDGVQKELVELGIREESVEKVADFLRTLRFQKTTLGRPDNIGIVIKPVDNVVFNKETLGRLEDEFEQSNCGEESSENFYNGKKCLEEILDLTKYFDCRNNIEIDVSLARGLSYYTGTIFEIVLTKGDFAGSIGGGGRYDGLIGMFGKEQIPACGFSLGLERILVVMEEREMFQKLVDEGKLELDSADVLVTVWNEETIGESLKLAAELRKENLRVLVYPETDKLSKQFKYAGQINVPFVCVLGETELTENKVTLKNMQTGEQQTVSREQTASKLKSISLQNG